jgi:hypothetical protein
MKFFTASALFLVHEEKSEAQAKQDRDLMGPKSKSLRGVVGSSAELASSLRQTHRADEPTSVSAARVGSPLGTGWTQTIHQRRGRQSWLSFKQMAPAVLLTQLPSSLP